MKLSAIILLFWAIWFVSSGGVADERAEVERAELENGGGAALPANFDLFTLGGKQFWSDELVFRGWRIQRHVLSGHCRLLDERNVRRAWGDFEQCRAEFEERRKTLGLKPLKGKVVILLHGLVRSRDAMSSLAEHLREQGGLEVVNVSYASTRDDIDAHAKSLTSVIEHLGPVDEISFVGHSMGNLVIRRFLATRDPQTTPQPRRVVMLAPPNHGSQLARRFRDNQVFRVVWGTSGLEIADWEELEAQLATPEDFGIIAGGSGSESGGNPLIPGDDDFVVSVAETRLAGARDFLVFPVFHGSIVDHPRIHEHTLNFLKHGYFVSEEKRQPIPRETPLVEHARRDVSEARAETVE